MKTTSSLAVTRRSLLRAQALFGILLTVSAVAPRTAHAARSPLIHGRAAWQARSPRGTVRLSSGRPRRLIIHHTATGNTSDGSLARAYSLARAIQSHHMDTFGWIDTGQHFTVSRGAFILEGRDGSLDSLDSAQGMVIGSHCYGQNTVSIGIETREPTPTLHPRKNSTRHWWGCVPGCAVSTDYPLRRSTVTGTSTPRCVLVTPCTPRCRNCDMTLTNASLTQSCRRQDTSLWPMFQRRRGKALYRSCLPWSSFAASARTGPSAHPLGTAGSSGAVPAMAGELNYLRY